MLRENKTKDAKTNYRSRLTGAGSSAYILVPSKGFGSARGPGAVPQGTPVGRAGDRLNHGSSSGERCRRGLRAQRAADRLETADPTPPRTGFGPAEAWVLPPGNRGAGPGLRVREGGARPQPGPPRRDREHPRKGPRPPMGGSRGRPRGSAVRRRLTGSPTGPTRRDRKILPSSGEDVRGCRRRRRSRDLGPDCVTRPETFGAPASNKRKVGLRARLRQGTWGPKLALGLASPETPRGWRLRPRLPRGFSCAAR
jgi:hypothetical protein